MAKTLSCTAMVAPRWLLVAAGLLVGYLLLVLIMGMVNRARVNRLRPDSFTQPTFDLIYVYMERCGHCKQFDPTWTQFQKQNEVALAAAGVTANKLKNDDPRAKALGVGGYPSVLLVSTSVSDQGSIPIPFEGPRTVDGLVTFLRANVPAFSI